MNLIRFIIALVLLIILPSEFLLFSLPAFLMGWMDIVLAAIIASGIKRLILKGKKDKI